jgi:hypothetical protein
MRKFKRRGDVISSELSSDEVRLLESLFHQLIDMLQGSADSGEPAEETQQSGAENGPSSAEDESFAAWARELADDTPVEAPQDPVIARLLPDAYPNDPKASAEFRRLTDRDLRDKKVQDAQTALAHLAQTQDGTRDLQIPVAEVDHWLRGLTNVRIAVAGRLGITDDTSAEELAQVSEDDPRAFMASVYDWLGYAQETLVMAL